MLKVNVETIGLKVVDAKLLMAAPRILAQNRLMVTAILEQARGITAAATPLGPGHFGYHGRDTVKVRVTSKGVRTIGEIRAAIQLYWREYGTRGAFRGGRAKLTARQSRLAHAFSGSGGEPAFMTAHKAVNVTKRMITFYYGGMAKWWRS